MSCTSPGSTPAISCARRIASRCAAESVSGRLSLARSTRAPAHDLRVDGQARGPCVGGPHQQHDAAALARQEARRVLVVDPHVGRREQAGLGQADQIERIDAQVDTAGHRDVKLACGQRQARGRDRGQRRRPGRVHRQTAAAQAELAADSGGEASGRCCPPASGL